ncbi:MAG: hypothetical protein JWR54_3421 [Mucilaginibacter sp.]|nr:hypothetical protein [Mucilaginibacter sp.]
MRNALLICAIVILIIGCKKSSNNHKITTLKNVAEKLGVDIKDIV